MDHHLEDLEAIRRHFGLDRLTVLGHSWGGMVAARYAAAYPDRTSRLLLMDPMPPARALRTAAGPRARALLEERLTASQRLRLDSLTRYSHTSQSPRAHCQRTHEIMARVYFRDSTSAARARGDFCAGSEAALRARPRVSAAMGALGDWDVRPMLSAVRIPVLVVHGADGAIPPEAMYEWAQALPNARLLTVSRAGHYLHVDRPDVFFPAAREFLRGVWPAGAIVVRESPPRPQAVDGADRGKIQGLDRLISRGWIRELKRSEIPRDSDLRRRYCAITEDGLS